MPAGNLRSIISIDALIRPSTHIPAAGSHSLVGPKPESKPTLHPAIFGERDKGTARCGNGCGQNSVILENFCACYIVNRGITARIGGEAQARRGRPTAGQ